MNILYLGVWILSIWESVLIHNTPKVSAQLSLGLGWAWQLSRHKFFIIAIFLPLSYYYYYSKYFMLQVAAIHNLHAIGNNKTTKQNFLQTLLDTSLIFKKYPWSFPWNTLEIYFNFIKPPSKLSSDTLDICWNNLWTFLPQNWSLPESI